MPTLPPERVKEVEQTVNAAMRDPNVPKSYANGFHIGQTASDIFIVALLAGAPVGIQYMSFNAAKSLMASLQKVIGDVETKTGQHILLIEEVQSRMTAKGDQ